MEKYNKETMAKVVGRSLPISTRHTIEICSFIRGKNLQKAKEILEKAIKLEKPIPFTKFNKGIGHKPGMGPGRYPVKASTDVLMLLNSVESNAQFKGLNTSKLTITHIKATTASKAWHYGRQRRRKMKRTNIEIIIGEKESKKTKQVKKETPTKEIKEKSKVKEIKTNDQKDLKQEETKK